MELNILASYLAPIVLTVKQNHENKEENFKKTLTFSTVIFGTFSEVGTMTAATFCPQTGSSIPRTATSAMSS